MDLHRQFLHFAKEKRKITYKLLSLLPEIFTTGIYKKYAGTIEGYAYRYAGIPESTARKTLNLNKLVSKKPKLKQLVSEVGVHKVSAVAGLINDENEDLMIDKIRNMSLSALTEFAKECRGTEKIEQITVKLNQKQRKLLSLVKKKIDPNLSFEEVLEKLCESYLNIETAEKPLKKAKSRYIPVELKNQTKQEYNYLCAYGDCCKPASELHHQVPYSIAGSHDCLVPLCKEHHEFMHNNLVANSDQHPAFWNIQLLPTTSAVDLKYQKMRM